MPVTEALKSHILNLKNGGSWRELQHAIPGWKWSHGLLRDLAIGKVASTSLAVYEALGVAPPTVIIAGPGSVIIGSGAGLISDNQPVIFIAIPPEEWQRHSMVCEVCGASCPRWSSTQKYCERHSWSTHDGRRYWKLKINRR